MDPDFTFQYFSALIESLLPEEKRSAKGLLTQEQIIPGLGNATAQDILFQARLHLRHPIDEMSELQRQTLYDAIVGTVRDVTTGGGRYDECDLYGNAGRYIRIMDSKSAGKPCPVCGTEVQNIQYLGGNCYFCPQCQK